MAAKRLPSAVYLRALFRYDPETGRLSWRTRYDAPPRWNALFAGRRAGYVRQGRRRVELPGGRSVSTCRIIWKMVHGREPECVDHVNGDPLDERLVNLRAATRSQNARNRRGHGASGFKGAYLIPRTGRWRATISVRGRRISLGTYDTPEDAHAAYVHAARKHFGSFARTNCIPHARRRQL